MGRSYAVALAIASAGLAAAPAVALAAVGDVIRSVTLPAGTGPNGDFCLLGIGTSVAVVPGGAVGLPAEPILLVTSCFSSGLAAEDAQALQLFFFRPDAGPATPILVVTTTVTPPRGWGSLALRTDKGDLLACGNRVAGGEGTHDLYRIPLSKSFATSESPTTTPVRLFSGQSGYGYDI